MMKDDAGGCKGQRRITKDDMGQSSPRKFDQYLDTRRLTEGRKREKIRFCISNSYEL